jgi:hypothetical protein
MSTMLAPFEQRQQHAHCEHVAVKKRQNDGVTIRFEGVEDDAAAGDVVQEVAVREHRALGTTGGAGGVDDDGQDQTPNASRWSWKMAELGIGRRPLRLNDLQGRTRFDVRAAACAPSSSSVIKHVNAGVFQDVADFIVGLRKLLMGTTARGGIEDAEEGGDEFGAVLEPEADAGRRAGTPNRVMSWWATAWDLLLQRGEGEVRFHPSKGRFWRGC